MILTEIDPVASSALPIDEFAQHLRLGSGFADDGAENPVLENYLRAALAAIEAQTGKAIYERRLMWTVQKWRRGDWQGIPLAPVKQIESVTVIDGGGSPHSISSDAYFLEKDAHYPIICARGTALPYIAPGGEAEIVIIAGYGAEWSAIPHDLRQAVFLLATNYFEHRHGLSSSLDVLPGGIPALLENYRPARLGGGRP